MDIKTIAVVGAGVMGSDIALDLSCFGYNVILKDLDNETLEKAEDKIEKDFKMVKMMKKDIKALSSSDILGNITFTTSYEDFAGVDFLIENIIEDWEQKKALYLELQKVCREDIIFGVNTSCISITKIGALMPYPEKVIGMHFMNPVPLKRIVEVIRGFHTADETVESVKAFLKTLGKRAVVVKDFPGFVTNRVSHLFMNEAAFLVQDQVAEPAAIDLIFTQGFGHKMGPLATADLIGLDTVMQSLDVLYESYQDPKFRCCPLLRKMVDAGLLGRKSGKGFFEYK
ncbi:MAG: 3-hydroxyacyl-CoA dehydrogenase family protein [Candidatus Aminicenantes bacterium]|nr:3-hydroxyacyl-CoA dehydrogenase family protein [Candidatus Aminicenantes bacterium]